MLVKQEYEEHDSALGQKFYPEGANNTLLKRVIVRYFNNKEDMAMKRLLVLSLTAAVLAVSFVSYAAQDAIELKLGSKMPENNPESQGVLRVCELVEERSKGRLKIINVDLYSVPT